MYQCGAFCVSHALLLEVCLRGIRNFVVDSMIKKYIQTLRTSPVAYY